MNPGGSYVYLLKYLTRKSLVKWTVLSFTVPRVKNIFDSILRRVQKYVFSKLLFLLTKQIREVFQLFALYAVGKCLIFLLFIVTMKLY